MQAREYNGDMENEYDSQGAARFLDISRQAVQQHVDKQHIRYHISDGIGNGKKKLFFEADLIDFVYGAFYTCRPEWERKHGKRER